MADNELMHIDQPVAGPSSLAGSKRRRNEDDEDDPNGPTAVQGTSQGDVPRFKKARLSSGSRTSAPKRPNDWHMKRGEIPLDADKTKNAFEVHLRALWCLPTQSSVPPVVRETDKLPFNSRFSSEMQVKSTVTTSLTQHASGINNARHRVQEFLRSLPENSIISANIRRIGQNHLLLMFRTVASLGLDRWAPDVLSNDPESMYNLLHEHIALLTFEQVSGAFGYSFIGNNLAFTHDFALLRKIYRSFVFAYMSKIVRSENKKPGSVARTKEMVNVWKRRDDLKTGRVDTAKAWAFNDRVISSLEENESHSDDELASDDITIPDGMERPIYVIKQKEGRSLVHGRFCRMLDTQRKKTSLGRKKHHKQERIRFEPDPPIPSSLTTLPKRVMVDWFDPVFWNGSMTIRERAEYTKDGAWVALPLEEHCQTWEHCAKWKNLSDHQFMEQYGKEVLALYTLPTEEELARLEELDKEGDVQDNSDENQEDPAGDQGIGTAES